MKIMTYVIYLDILGVENAQRATDLFRKGGYQVIELHKTVQHIQVTLEPIKNPVYTVRLQVKGDKLPHMEQLPALWGFSKVEMVESA